MLAGRGWGIDCTTAAVHHDRAHCMFGSIRNARWWTGPSTSFDAWSTARHSRAGSSVARAGLALSLAGRLMATTGLDDRSALGYVPEESLHVGCLTELASFYNKIVKNSLAKRTEATLQ